MADASIPGPEKAAIPQNLEVDQAEVPTIGQLPPDAETGPPKKQTWEQKREAALDEINAKWKDRFKSGEDSEDFSTDVPAADEPVEAVEAADAGAEGAATEDRKVDTDLAHRQRLAATYGVPVEHLAGFSSAKDAEQALALRDEMFFGGRQPAERPPGEQQPAEPGKSLSPEQQERKDLGLDYSEWEDGEPIKKNLSTIEKSVLDLQQQLQQSNERLQFLQAEQHRRESAERAQVFHHTLESVDPDLYGTGSELTPEQSAMREFVAAKVEQYAAQFEQQYGFLPPDTAGFTRRVTQHLRLGKPATDTQAAPEQPPAPKAAAPRAQLGPPGRAQPRAKSSSGKLEDFDGDPRDNPKLHEFYEELLARNAG
jgi:hypothetical protein